MSAMKPDITVGEAKVKGIVGGWALPGHGRTESKSRAREMAMQLNREITRIRGKKKLVARAG